MAADVTADPGTGRVTVGPITINPTRDGALTTTQAQFQAINDGLGVAITRLNGIRAAAVENGRVKGGVESRA